jgi:hypothetical protein
MTKNWFKASIFVLGVIASVLSLQPSVSRAGEANADVIEVQATDRGSSGWTFRVTVAHPDTGWEDYCNGWDVVTDQGEVLKTSTSDQFTRVLLHPHEAEQPFTRSQSGIQIPAGIKKLIVRAHDLVDGFGGKEIEIDLSQKSGPGYTISN